VSDGSLQFDVAWDSSKGVAGLDEFEKKLDAVTAKALESSNAIVAALNQINGVQINTGIFEAIQQQGQAAADTAEKASTLSTATEQATNSSKGHAAALETETQAQERLRKMVDESVAAQEKQNKASEAWKNGNPFQSTANSNGGAAGVAGQNAQMRAPIDGRTLQEAAAASDALAARSEKLMSSVDGSYAAQVKWNKALKEAEALFKADAISQAELTAVQNAAKKAMEGVSEGAHLSSGAMREMIVLMREAGRGDFTRMAGSASILAQRMGYLELLFNPITIGIVALTAGTVAYALAVQNAQEKQNTFNNMLSLTGNFAGLTADSYYAMARKISDSAGGSISANEKLISSLASIHTLTAGEMEKVVASSQLLARATGQDAEKVIESFQDAIKRGPTAYAQEIADKYPNVIGPAILDHIRLLEETGRTQEAMAAAINAATDGIANNTKKDTGIIRGAWDEATSGLSNYFGHLARYLTGTESDAEKLRRLQIDRALTPNDALHRSDIAALDRQISQAQQQLVLHQKQADAQAKDAQAVQAATDAQRTLSGETDRYADRTKQLANARAADIQRLKTLQAGADAAQHQSQEALASGDRKAAQQKAADAEFLRRKYAELSATINSKTYQDNQTKAFEPNATRDAKKADRDSAKQAREEERAAKKLGDELERLKAQYEQVTTADDKLTISNALASAGLSRTADITQGVAKQIADLVTSIRSAQEVKKLTDDTEELNAKTADLGRTHIESALAAERHKLGIEDISKASNEAQEAYEKFKQALIANETASAIQKLTQETDQWVAKLQQLNQNEEQAYKTHLLEVLGIKDITKATQEQVTAYNNALAAKQKLDAAEASKTLKKKLDDDNQKLAQDKDKRDNPWDANLNRANAAIKKQVDEMNELLAKIPKGAEEYQQMSDAITAYQKNAKDNAALDDSIEKADKLAGIMENVWSNPEQAMKQYFEQFLAYIAKAIIQSAILGKSLPGGGGAGGLLKSAIGSIFGFATGGSVDAGVPIRVGEQGEEMFVPQTAGTIVTNRQLGNMGGGGSNITVGGTTIVVQGNADEKTLQHIQAQITQQRRQMITEIDSRFQFHTRRNSR